MPRIPVRTEPYSSPSRQHRHFKNKRDQILRALGKAAFINGSHFAIIWVNAKGETETYASDLFQGTLDRWFNGAVVSEAKDLVKKEREEKKERQKYLPPSSSSINAASAVHEVLKESKRRKKLERAGLLVSGPMLPHSHAQKQGLDDSGYHDLEDEDLEGQMDEDEDDHERRFLADGASLTAPPEAYQSAKAVATLLPMDQNLPISQLSCHPSSMSTGTPDFKDGGLNAPRGSLGPPLPITGPSHSFKPASLLPDPSLDLVHFPSSESVDTFLSGRFSLLQHTACKIICKAWIKVIEPKKQTRFPYQGGEGGRPEWWPAHVRHREPDHLMKPERISLLVSLLRSGLVPLARLELATAEISVYLSATKMALLKDVYKVVKETERINGSASESFIGFSVCLPPLDHFEEENSPQPKKRPRTKRGEQGPDSSSQGRRQTRQSRKKSLLAVPAQSWIAQHANDDSVPIPASDTYSGGTVLDRPTLEEVRSTNPSHFLPSSSHFTFGSNLPAGSFHHGLDHRETRSPSMPPLSFQPGFYKGLAVSDQVSYPFHEPEVDRFRSDGLPSSSQHLYGPYIPHSHLRIEDSHSSYPTSELRSDDPFDVETCSDDPVLNQEMEVYVEHLRELAAARSHRHQRGYDVPAGTLVQGGHYLSSATEMLPAGSHSGVFGASPAPDADSPESGLAIHRPAQSSSRRDSFNSDPLAQRSTEESFVDLDSPSVGSPETIDQKDAEMYLRAG